MEHILLQLSHNLKTYLIRSIPLDSIFYTTHPFVKKTYNWKLREKKSFVNNGTIFFEIRNYAKEWCHHKKMNKEGFLN